LRIRLRIVRVILGIVEILLRPPEGVLENLRDPLGALDGLVDLVDRQHHLLQRHLLGELALRARSTLGVREFVTGPVLVGGAKIRTRQVPTSRTVIVQPKIVPLAHFIINVSSVCRGGRAAEVLTVHTLDPTEVARTWTHQSLIVLVGFGGAPHGVVGAVRRGRLHRAALTTGVEGRSGEGALGLVLRDRFETEPENGETWYGDRYYFGLARTDL
jgi:hypothetical protein